MIKRKLYLIIPVTLSFYVQTQAQSIARQVLSSQGATKQLETGQLISQTIGQNGIMGSLNEKKGIQGFQQPMTGRFKVLPEELKSKLVIYPNPFEDILKINVPDVVDRTNFLVQVFDSSGGKLLHSQNLLLENTTLSIELGKLFPGAYMLKVISDKINFSSIIFKK